MPFRKGGRELPPFFVGTNYAFSQNHMIAEFSTNKICRPQAQGIELNDVWIKKIRFATYLSAKHMLVGLFNHISCAATHLAPLINFMNNNNTNIFTVFQTGHVLLLSKQLTIRGYRGNYSYYRYNQIGLNLVT